MPCRNSRRFLELVGSLVQVSDLGEQIGIVRVGLQFSSSGAALLGHLFHLFKAGHLAAHTTCGGRRLGTAGAGGGGAGDCDPRNKYPIASPTTRLMRPSHTPASLAKPMPRLAALWFRFPSLIPPLPVCSKSALAERQDYANASAR
jgi:hypothetical protein